MPGEHRLLERFADLRALTRPRHDEADDDAGLAAQPAGAPARLPALARPGGRGAPARLRRACSSGRSAHYGVESLDRTPALEDGLLPDLPRAGARRDRPRRPSWRSSTAGSSWPGTSPGSVGNDFREALDRLVGAMEGRDPVVADLAREVRFRYFDEPLIAETRDRTYAAMDRHLDALADDPERADRDERIAALVACPRPLAPLIVARMHGAGPAQRRVLLEVVTRRFYRVRTLEGFTEERRRRPASCSRPATATTGRGRHLATALRRARRAAGRERRLRRVGGRRCPRATSPSPTSTPGADAALPAEERAEQLRAALARAPLPRVRAPDRGRRRRAGARPRHGGDARRSRSARRRTGRSRTTCSAACTR